MHCALFQEFVEIIFKFSADLDVRNESTVKSGIFPRRRFETCFLYLAEYSVKNFITTRQYLVNLTCASVCACVRVVSAIQDVCSVSSKTDQLYVYAFCRLFSGVARIFC